MSSQAKIPAPPAASDGDSMQAVIARDRPPAPPAILRETSFVDLGSEDLPAERWLSREFHEREKARLWPRVWQMACHLQQIPNVGDHEIYEINDRSLIVVRTAPDRIKAFYNACLHRGTQLRDEAGCVKAFTCPYHGWTWSLEGALQHIPAQWDFAHVDKAKSCLPEARVDTWGGFVWVNFDPAAPPLAEYLEDLPEHFAHWPLEDRWLAGHVVRVMPANWKVAMEAFIESYHVYPVHPEFWNNTGYWETQVDLWPGRRHVSRMLTPLAVPGSLASRGWTQQQLADSFSALMEGTVSGRLEVPAGRTAREVYADDLRAAFARSTGVDVSASSDCEILDGLEYYLFPNFLPWGSYSLPIAYRFRPNGDDHESSLMEIYLIPPFPTGQPMPPAAKTRVLGPGEGFAAVPEMGMLGRILDQDYANMVRVQRGMKASKKRTVTLANYQEARIRHYHRTLDEYLAG
ncbi:MAG: SRPBCC family protein [Gammaproteobacteria bacterium]